MSGELLHHKEVFNTRKMLNTQRKKGKRERELEAAAPGLS